MPYYNRDPRRGHNLDNHPHRGTISSTPSIETFFGLRTRLTRLFFDSQRPLYLQVASCRPLQVEETRSLRDSAVPVPRHKATRPTVIDASVQASQPAALYRRSSLTERVFTTQVVLTQLKYVPAWESIPHSHWRPMLTVSASHNP